MPTQLKTIRQQRRLTQVEVAEAAGIHQGYLSELERTADPTPGWHVVRALAKVLRAEPGELFPEAPPKRGRRKVQG